MDVNGNVVLNGKPPPKGHWGGICNRGACDHEQPRWWSSVEKAYYCRPCALTINKHLPAGVAPMVEVKRSVLARIECALDFAEGCNVIESLVPEQCVLIDVDGAMYHVQLVKLTEKQEEPGLPMFTRTGMLQQPAHEQGSGSGPSDRASSKEPVSKIAFVPNDEQALDLLCKMNNIPKTVMLKAAAIVETILGNLAASDVVTHFGTEVVNSVNGLRGYKWDMVVDLARAMDEQYRSQD